MTSLGEEKIRSGIPGLFYIPEVITREDEKKLIQNIDAQPYDTTLSRRTQQYGYRYNYGRGTDANAPAPPIPSFFDDLLSTIHGWKPNQIIVNEYEPGQGIAAHTDSPIFGEIIISFSLLSAVEMTIGPMSVILEPRSALVLTGEARWKHTHEIHKRKSDVINGVKTPRSRRISVTVREKIAQ
jgi:alkylated DNA repair dioxygenase AlkB